MPELSTRVMRRIACHASGRAAASCTDGVWAMPELSTRVMRRIACHASGRSAASCTDGVWVCPSGAGQTPDACRFSTRSRISTIS